MIIRRLCILTDFGYWMIQGVWEDALPTPDVIPTKVGPYRKVRETAKAVFYARQEAANDTTGADGRGDH